MFIAYEILTMAFGFEVDISINIIPEVKEVKKTTLFKDVIGIDDYKEELQEEIGRASCRERV